MNKNDVFSDDEKERRVRVARNQYLREWRKKNRDKYLKNNEKFWLKQYEKLLEENSNDELQEELKHDEH